MDLCVHCGFCLQACPTYLALEDENDSPRGRIVLMQGVLAGDIDVSDAAMNSHLSRCLGCRGCETACPSGVPYGHLLEATRATLRESNSTPLIARLVLGVFAQPFLLRTAMLLGRAFRATGMARVLAKLPGRAGIPFAMLASTAPGHHARKSAASARNRAAQSSTARDSNGTQTVALFEGCVMRGLYSHVNEASRAVLARNGYALRDVAGQQCCGALHAHAGDLNGARARARVNIEAFELSGPDAVAVNAAGCGALLKEYHILFSGDAAWEARAAALAARVKDVSELLYARGPATGNPLNVAVAYDAPCHLQHAQRVTEAPLAVLRAIPSLRLAPTADSDKCCGAAGIYNLIEPETSAAVLAPKLAELQRSGATIVCTGNPGCMMQIGAALLRSGSQIEVMHPVELLHASYSEE
jgi:glycolate oxidase iron-sulfur subunit